MFFLDRFLQPNISKLEKSRDIYRLFQALHYEPNPKIRKDAFDVLIRICRENEGRFAERLNRNLFEQEKIDTLNVLAEIGEPYSSSTLEDVSGCLSNDSWEIREASARALGNFGSDRAKPVLLKALKERRFFSDAFLDEMRRSRDTGTHELMIAALAVQEGKVQIAIVEALERIAPKGSRLVLDDLAELKKALNIYARMKPQRPTIDTLAESVAKVEKELSAAVDKAVQTLSDPAKTSASEMVDQETHITAGNGKAVPVLTAEATKKILNLAQDRKIEAIKRVRELTGLGFKEAKDYVEALAPDQSESSYSHSVITQLSSFEVEVELKSLLAQGQRFQAIKRARQLTGWGLKEARDYVDMLRASDGRAVNVTISGKGLGSRGITDCYKCGRSVGDGSLSNTTSALRSGSFSDMTYDCKSCGKKYCLDCMSILKKGNGICDACGGKLGW